MTNFDSEPILESIPKLFISNAEVIEGNDFEGNDFNNVLEFTVTLDRPSTESIFVMMEASGYLPDEYNYYLPNDVADWDDMYYMTMESLIFEPGETEKTFSVQVYPDLEIENDEEVFATVSYVDGNVEIADGLGIGTIINDDFATENLTFISESSTAEPSLQYRINVGGEQIADDLMDWSEDTNSNPSVYRVGDGGARIYQKTTTNIDLSDESLPTDVPEAIFKSERWDPISGSNMQWEFDVDSGNYEVRLYFAEIYQPIDVAEERVFDVAVEDSVPGVFNDVDIYASVGQYSGFMLSHTTTVSDGSLSLEFIHDIQNPALKGIEIFSLGETVI